MKPRAIAWLLAALITLPFADSVFQIPIQVSDSLEPIVISAKLRDDHAAAPWTAPDFRRRHSARCDTCRHGGCWASPRPAD